MGEAPRLNGIINLDKSPGMSSARAVARVKRLLPKGNKIGHAGTLDPFATGVLLLLIGKATKTCEKLMGQRKGYDATIKLGATTATDDLEAPEEAFGGAGRDASCAGGDVSEAGGGGACADTAENSTRVVSDPIPPTPEQIQSVAARFIGEIEQQPPVFSALKVGGRRAYELARKGKDFTVQARKVTVYELRIIDYAWPFLKIHVECGRGTYIRAIARDMGKALGVGGYLTELRRTAIGNFGIESAVTLEQVQADGVEKWLQPIDGLSIA